MATLSSDGKYVTVVKGDTLWAIAKKHLGAGTKYKQLASWNNISNPDFIVVGQRIYLSKEAASGTAGTTNKSSTTSPTITNFGMLSTSDDKLIATWTWGKESQTESYKVLWRYTTLDGVTLVGSNSTNTVDKDVYAASRQSEFTIPSGAASVYFKVKPISKTKDEKKKTTYFTANWSVEKKYTVTTPLKTPSNLKVDLKDLKLTAEATVTDSSIKQVEFQLYKNNKTHSSSKTVDVANSATGYASCVWTSVDEGAVYTVRCRSVKGKVYSDWTSFSSSVETRPTMPSGITTCKAIDETTVYLEWPKSDTAESYKIQYTTKKEYFNGTDVAIGEVTEITTEATARYISDIETGKEYFFRVQSVGANDQKSPWTEPVSVVLGTAPAAPTTWSSTTTATVGEIVNLYWLHNSEDGSEETWAELELYVGKYVIDSSGNKVFDGTLIPLDPIKKGDTGSDVPPEDTEDDDEGGSGIGAGYYYNGYTSRTTNFLPALPSSSATCAVIVECFESSMINNYGQYVLGFGTKVDTTDGVNAYLYGLDKLYRMNNNGWEEITGYPAPTFPVDVTGSVKVMWSNTKIGWLTISESGGIGGEGDNPGGGEDPGGSGEITGGYYYNEHTSSPASLPALPSWDSATYPIAVLVDCIDSSIKNLYAKGGQYALALGGLNSKIQTTDRTTLIGLSKLYYPSGNGWVENTSYTNNYTTLDINYPGIVEVIWSNTKIDALTESGTGTPGGGGEGENPGGGEDPNPGGSEITGGYYYNNYTSSSKSFPALPSSSASCAVIAHCLETSMINNYGEWVLVFGNTIGWQGTDRITLSNFDSLYYLSGNSWVSKSYSGPFTINLANSIEVVWSKTAIDGLTSSGSGSPGGDDSGDTGDDTGGGNTGGEDPTPDPEPEPEPEPDPEPDPEPEPEPSENYYDKNGSFYNGFSSSLNLPDPPSSSAACAVVVHCLDSSMTAVYGGTYAIGFGSGTETTTDRTILKGLDKLYYLSGNSWVSKSYSSLVLDIEYTGFVEIVWISNT